MVRNVAIALKMVNNKRGTLHPWLAGRLSLRLTDISSLRVGIKTESPRHPVGAGANKERVSQ